MSKLIDELKNEHKWIQHLLGQVKSVGITSTAGIEKLLLSKKALLAHLKKEDDKLYPILRDAGKTNQDINLTLKMFTDDMKSITDQVISFYAKYENGIQNKLDFATDFGVIVSILNDRIWREETILYPKFESLFEFQMLEKR